MRVYAIIGLLILTLLVSGCNEKEIERILLTYGQDNCDCGVVEDAININILKQGDKILDVDISKSAFSASEDFTNEDKCTKIIQGNNTGYYCRSTSK